MTKNAYQLAPKLNKPVNSKRFDSFNIRIKPWRKNGNHILICPPGSVWEELNGLPVGKWLIDTVRDLKTDRPLIIRKKKESVPLKQQLENCWCVVTHSSNVAVDALLEGIPIICAPASCAYYFSSKLDEIECPRLPWLRYGFFCHLANNQFTLDEMRSGLCWEMLSSR